MTTVDRNDLVPAQEKLEWVTPKISLMGAGDTSGGKGGVLAFGEWRDMHDSADGELAYWACVRSFLINLA
jgi:hypothetical protein